MQLDFNIALKIKSLEAVGTGMQRQTKLSVVVDADWCIMDSLDSILLLYLYIQHKSLIENVALSLLSKLL